MNLLKIISVVTFLSLIAISCAKNYEEHDTIELKADYCEGWNEIGQLHNDGLELLFEKLQQSDLVLNYEISSQITYEFALSYYEVIQSNIYPPHYPISYQLHEDIVKESMSNVDVLINGDNDEIFDYFTSVGVEEEVVVNILRILNIFENEEFNSTFYSLKIELDKLKSELKNAGQWNYVLDDTYNVAIATYCYWKNNISKWHNELSDPDQLQTRASTFLRTGRADLLGAAAGAWAGDGPGSVGGALTASGLTLLASVLWP